MRRRPGGFFLNGSFATIGGFAKKAKKEIP
jgi:hypothetical protein